MRFPLGARVAIEEDYAGGLAAIVHRQVTHNRAADQREPAGAGRVGEGGRRTVEVGCRIAAALALIAIVAGGPAIVRLRQIRRAIRNDPPAQLALHDFARMDLTARETHGGEEFPIRKLWQAFHGSAYADVAFHAVIIRFQVFVGDGPVLAITIARGRLELEVTVAIADARPAEGLAAHLASANPHERFVLAERCTEAPGR